MEDFVASAEQELKELADAGNSIAKQWLEKIQAESDVNEKLYLFGEIKVALMHDATEEAVQVRKVMFES